MKKPIILIILGLLLLGGGGALSFVGGPPQANAELTQKCRETLTARAADAATVDQCKEVAFATAMTATDAQSAARAISAANNSEIGSNTVAMFLMGLGLVFVLGGVFLRRKQMKAA
ncbi:LPXTG cell wall anchor domain-containing protein [Phyllobacterium sp. 628]|uniref:LPXTG cell wall anchor domain-containing protein n=1 Tax=Phyllobacterium sp. 628 TaxID=2718938 RepID=UPI001AEF102A|nr:LPXTG cell wall anchor domain-containing protein [Phyllobacterium sp. 628]